MKHSEILKQARRKIQSRKCRFICEAVRRTTYYGGSDTVRRGKDIMRYISRELGKHSALGAWLAINRPELSRNHHSMRKYRLQWIDWMIEQYESTGR